MEMTLVDAHVHLSSDDFVGDIESILVEAFDRGIKTVLNVTTTEAELERSFSYADKFSFMKFHHIAGIPPQDVLEPDLESNRIFFQKKATEGLLVAIGEVGLDYVNCDDQVKTLQKKVFVDYLHLALTFRLPLVIHCRHAFNDFFDLLDSEYLSHKNACPGMLHCFTGSAEEARKLVDRGWFVSLSGILTFKNGQSLRDTALYLPWEHLLIETDAPFLSPVPLRGKRNQPGNLVFIAQALADLKGTSFQEVVEATNQNISRFLSP